MIPTDGIVPLLVACTASALWLAGHLGLIRRLTLVISTLQNIQAWSIQYRENLTFSHLRSS